MTKLSPKAIRFVDAAVRRTEDRISMALWNTHIPGRELSPQLAGIALAALRAMEGEMEHDLRVSSDEDVICDLSNDLSFVRSIKDDLRRDVDDRGGFRMAAILQP